MKGGGFFLKAAVHHLVRGGQRNLVAFFCVAFGVMSLVAMTTLANSIESMLTLEPYELIGGDLTLDRVDEDSISSAEEAELQNLLASGQIERYTLIDYSTSLSFRTAGSGQLNFPSTAMGVDPNKYPLAGNLTISDPRDVDLIHLLKNPGDVVITRDLALTYHLSVGDALVLADLNFGQPLAGTVRGIASDTPNHQGSKIYYSHETSQRLTGLERTVNTVLVNAQDPASVAQVLEDSGWRVFTAQQLASITAAREGSMAMALNDIGLMGLLVGGIGIANTMQVLLQRRRKEVAVWKTLGYTSGQIQAMFVTEAGLLGLGGSLFGVGLGVLLSYGIVGLFSRITTVLVRWTFSPPEALSGLAIGVLTTVLFAMWAIVSTSRIRPLALLRNEILDTAQLPLLQGAGLALLLAVPFLAIAVWVLKSFLIGLIVLFASILALAMTGFGLWILLRLLLWLLPIRRWPLGRISYHNLRRRGSSMMFAMTALFIGVMMLGTGAVITEGGQQVVSALNGPDTAENLAIYASPVDEAGVINELVAAGVQQYSSSHNYQVQAIHAEADPAETFSPTLTGRSDPGPLILTGAAWGTRPDGIYTFAYLGLPTGSKLRVTGADGTLHELEVVGAFAYSEDAVRPGERNYLMVSEELGRQVGTPINSQFYLSIQPAQLPETVQRLGKALPQATLLSMPDYRAHFVRQYQNLFVFAAAMAGLAILAGMLLVANSVSLAMLDRRFEIGVLKSIGYSRRQVLLTLVVEYTWMSATVCLAGLGLIWGALFLAGLANQMVASLLTLRPLTAALIAGLTIGLTALTVLWATWKPCSVSPVFVLNDRE